MNQSSVRKRQVAEESSCSLPLPSANTSRSDEKHDRQIHKAQDSLFCSSSAWTNHQGVFNLTILLLVVSNGRVAFENLIKYGVLISPTEWFILAPVDASKWTMVTMILWSNVSILLALFAEKLLARGIFGNRFAVGFYVTLILAHFTIPAIQVLNYDGNPLFSFCGLTVLVIEGLKLISYGHVNYWYRCAQAENSNKKSTAWSYPNNLTVFNMYYYMFAPTLCYELHFPRSPTRRKQFIFKRLIELITFSFLIIALSQQWMIPLVKNSITPFSEAYFKHYMERLLKLVIPNHLLWLLGFYALFHSALNLMAEILCFADREFYLDFWNSETITYFWRSWNIPVHRWAVRHVYKPLVNRGCSRSVASSIVFFVSGLFHEYLVSVPLHMFRFWAFNGMLAQIPLILITDKLLKGGRFGNIVVWLSLILGQPIAILLYMHDWFWLNYPDAQLHD